MEKYIRVYDLDKHEVAPQALPPSTSGIRCMSWVQDDNLILCSYTDKPGIG